MDTSTQEKHQSFTRNEYTGNQYYSFVINTLKEAGISSIIDAGACVGEVTKVLIENIPTLKTCYLIEPISQNVKFIEGVFKDVKNPYIKIHQKALFYGKDEVEISFWPHNVGSGSVFLNDKKIKSESVKTITLEDFPVVDFLKLDIEGVEENIVLNSSNIQKIKFIEIEFHHYIEELSIEKNRVLFLRKHLPNHKVILDGAISDKSSSLFLSL